MLLHRLPACLLMNHAGETGLLKESVNPVAAIFFVFEKVAAILTRIAATFRRRKDSCYRAATHFFNRPLLTAPRAVITTAYVSPL